MTFLFTQVVARGVAIFLCVDCWRTLRIAIREGKIIDRRRDLIVMLFDPGMVVLDRDKTPAQYWLYVSIEGVTFLACIVVVIFGWWIPEK